jgi:hypothetical protein
VNSNKKRGIEKTIQAKMSASEARLNFDCTCAGWSGLNCILWGGGCCFFYIMLTFVLFSWVKIQLLLAEEEDPILSPSDSADADFGGYGYG